MRTVPLPKSAETEPAAWQLGWLRNATLSQAMSFPSSLMPASASAQFENSVSWKWTGRRWLVTTDMDLPEFEKRTVELADGTAINGVYVSMGNPHLVIVLPEPRPQRSDFGDDNANPLDAGEATLSGLDFSLHDRSWEEIGEEICLHPDFPDQTNVEFVHVLGSMSEPIHQVAIRIFERGVGPTTSSGTGTSAVATAMIGVYDAERELEVIASGGAQTVQWQGPGEKLYLTGPATLIARGEAFYK